MEIKVNCFKNGTDHIYGNNCISVATLQLFCAEVSGRSNLIRNSVGTN